ESPRNRFRTAASRLALATSQIAYGPRMPAFTEPVGIGGVKKDKLSMLQSSAFGRSLVALALCSAAFAFSVTPASARSHHGARRYAHAHYPGYHARRHEAYRHYRHVAHLSRWDAGVAQMKARGLADANASLVPNMDSAGMSTSGGFG